MPISVKDIVWIAGILEGEGYFGLNNNSPRIQLAMTDLDVVEHVKNIMEKTKVISSHAEHEGKDGSRRKTRYSFTITGDLAIQWMMTIYLLMGLRRKSKIRELIHHWKINDGKLRIIKNLKKLGLSQEQAEIQFLEILNSKS